ncbi:MFS transporter [Streptomyces coeruleorubidus]|uniref:MFS transporter n=1 Tax=Streptomyces coeruleorubidus TaxID=116188 RepID=UPI0036FF8DCC
MARLSDVAASSGSGDRSSSSDQQSGEIAARIDRIPTGRFHGKVAGLIGAGTFFDGFDAISLAVILPIVVQVFDLSLAEAGLIVSAGFLGQLIGAVVVGALSDRIGRRPAFLLSVAVFSCLSLACALAWSAESLLVFRVLQGIGIGAEVPIATTFINEFLGARKRGRMAVLFTSLVAWGIACAPLAGLLTVTAAGPEAGWRILLAIGALPLVLVLWGWFTLPESPRWLASVGRVAEAETIVAKMEREAQQHGHVLAEPRPPLVQAGHKFRATELIGRQYRTRTLTLWVIWFTTFFVTYGYQTWLPTMYVRIGGLDPSHSLMLTVALGILQVVMAFVAAWLVERIGRRALLMAGFITATAGGLFGFVVVGALGHTEWQALAASGMFVAVGIGIPSVTLWVYTAELFPTRMRGWATSTCSGMLRLSSIVSPILIGAILGGGASPGFVFALFALSSIVGLVTMSIFGVETRGRVLEEISS